jgi:plastocyanin
MVVSRGMEVVGLFDRCCGAVLPLFRSALVSSTAPKKIRMKGISVAGRSRRPGMRTNHLLLIACSVLAPALLASCGDDDDATGGGDATAAAEVTIERSRFEPRELTVAPGTEVSFENLDLATHTVTAADGSDLDFDSGSLGQGDVFTQTFDEAGTYDYFCEVHPTMRASVSVEG